jgi:glyoxylase-like metal-dependent hydrolase (beta-lactamase superfamily II)
MPNAAPRKLPKDPLTYPYEDGDYPAPGEVREVATDVFWVRMPMPGRLDHINVWLLRDYDGWTIVDTGLNRDNICALWEEIFEKHLDGKPVTRVFSTHLHGDHTGLAGWLVSRWGIELWMSRTDFFMCKLMAADGPSDIPEDALHFYHRAGFSEQRLDEYKARFGSFGASISPLPTGFHRVSDGDYIDIGGREWRVVVGRGHAPEHVCLYCPELKILIGGDQVLPRITPNVSVNPSEPLANPLKDWLTSCVHLRDVLPSNLLVLPAHQRLYYGLHERLTALIQHHETALSRLHDLCAEPMRSVDVFPAVFNSTITDETFFMATGESIAHINCALDRRMITVDEDEAGVAWYTQA